MAEHNHPADRAHLWERVSPAPDASPAAHTYAHALPRLLHKSNDHKRVDTPDECDAALADGWALLPVAAGSAEPEPEPEAAPQRRRR